ncbi:hypothetical protein LRP31_28450 [Mesorhizobium mediterraneum]|uniref:hypothetical protein n=1 Tax=Mesorhizobium TaxID=68287 RepID=UPI00122762F2|nr:MULTISPECIES: hypothetical protein [Mesorhizobium]TIT27730.1 MAG: hypothetical protein E5W78_18055 [Mesorhizobium sp.]WIW56975.1 hypothetical protein LRP31_28450 [Mesorhizobium mediterraneum]
MAAAKLRSPSTLQGRLVGLWGWLAGGWHLTREPAWLIADAGFTIQRQERSFPRLWQLGIHTTGEALLGAETNETLRVQRGKTPETGMV